MNDYLSAIRQGLWNENISIEKYSDNPNYQDHILEQYKLYVEMADRISARRNLANTFFLTLHTALIGAISFIYEKSATLIEIKIIIFPLLAILALCYAWWRLVKSYSQLNAAKYAVIGEMEKRLPASPYWSAEWKALGEGKNPKLYRPLTGIENYIPLIFGALYILGAIFLIL